MQITGGNAITHQLRLKRTSLLKRSRTCISTCRQAQAIAIITHRERSKNGDAKLVSSAIIIIMSKPQVIIKSRRSRSSALGISQDRRIIKYSPISTAKYHRDARLRGADTKLK